MPTSGETSGYQVNLSQGDSVNDQPGKYTSVYGSPGSTTGGSTSTTGGETGGFNEQLQQNNPLQGLPGSYYISGQGQPYDPNNLYGTLGTNLTQPANGGFLYADPRAFQDYNAGSIYGAINDELNNRSNQSAPTAGYTQLGGPQYANSSQLSPLMMLSGANLGTGQDMQYAAAQNQAINQLYAQAQGQGPSVATEQAKQLAQQNIAAQMAALGSQRGAGNAALGQRAAAMQAASANQAAAAQGALGRSQEALQAQSQLQGALQGARGLSQSTAQTQAQLQQQAMLANQQGALSEAGQNASLAQQLALANSGYGNQFLLQQGQMNQATNLANQQAMLQQSQLNNQAYNAGLSALMGQNQSDIGLATQLQQLWAQQEMGLQNVNAGLAVNTMNNAMGAVGAGTSAMGALLAAAAAASDENLKTAIRPARDELSNFLDGVPLMQSLYALGGL